MAICHGFTCTVFLLHRVSVSSVHCFPAKLCLDRLDERARRKEFVLSRGFTTTAKLQAEEKKAATPEERQLMHRLRKFARFMDAGEYEEFVDGILQQHRLKRRIMFLQVRAQLEQREIRCQKLTVLWCCYPPCAVTQAQGEDLAPPEKRQGGL